MDKNLTDTETQQNVDSVNSLHSVKLRYLPTYKIHLWTFGTSN